MNAMLQKSSFIHHRKVLIIIYYFVLFAKSIGYGAKFCVFFLKPQLVNGNPKALLPFWLIIQMWVLLDNILILISILIDD